MSLWLVLGSLRIRPVLRTRMPQWFDVALGAANTLSLRGVTSPGLTSLLDVGPLGDVRRSIDVPVVRNATGGTVRLGIVLHVQVRLADMTSLRSVRRINPEDTPTVGLNHIPCAPVGLAPEPATKFHGVLNMAQILEHYQSIAVPPGRVRDLLSNEDTQFTSSVGQVSPMRNRFLRAVPPL